MDELFWKSFRTFLKPIAALWETNETPRLYINSPDDIWIEQQGRLEQTSIQVSQEQLFHTVRHLAQLSGKFLNEENPFFFQRLEDGTALTVLLPPLVGEGPVLVLEREERVYLSLNQLVQEGALCDAASLFLKAALHAHRTIWIIGAEENARSVLMYALAEALPPAERTILLAEQPKEIHHPHLLHLSPSFEPKNLYEQKIPTLFDLIHALKPQRLLVEDLHPRWIGLLTSTLSSRYFGSLVSFGAVDRWQALSRWEAAYSAEDGKGSNQAQKAHIASSVSLIITCQSNQQGMPRITSIDESLPLDEHGAYRLRPLFRRFAVSSVNVSSAEKKLLPVGYLPSFWRELGTKETSKTSFYHPANYAEDAGFRERGYEAIQSEATQEPLIQLASWLERLEGQRHTSVTPPQVSESSKDTKTINRNTYTPIPPLAHVSSWKASDESLLSENLRSPEKFSNTTEQSEEKSEPLSSSLLRSSSPSKPQQAALYAALGSALSSLKASKKLKEQEEISSLSNQSPSNHAAQSAGDIVSDSEGMAKKQDQHPERAWGDALSFEEQALLQDVRHGSPLPSRTQPSMGSSPSSALSSKADEARETDYMQGDSRLGRAKEIDASSDHLGAGKPREEESLRSSNRDEKERVAPSHTQTARPSNREEAEGTSHSQSMQLSLPPFQNSRPKREASAEIATPSVGGSSRENQVAVAGSRSNLEETPNPAQSFEETNAHVRPQAAALQELQDVSFEEDPLESTHLTDLLEVTASQKEHLPYLAAASQDALPLAPETQAPTSPHAHTSELVEEDLQPVPDELDIYSPVQPRSSGHTQITDRPTEEAYAALNQQAARAPYNAPSAIHPHEAQITPYQENYSSEFYPASSAHMPYSSDYGGAYHAMESQSSDGLGGYDARQYAQQAHHHAGATHLDTGQSHIHLGSGQTSLPGQDISALMAKPTSQGHPVPPVHTPPRSVAVKRGQRQSVDELGVFTLDHQDTTAVRKQQPPRSKAIPPEYNEPHHEPFAPMSPPPQAAVPPPLPPAAKRAAPPPPPPAALRNQKAAQPEAMPPARESRPMISFAPEAPKAPPVAKRPPTANIPRPSIPPPSSPPPVVQQPVGRPPTKAPQPLAIDPFAPDEATLIRTRPKK